MADSNNDQRPAVEPGHATDRMNLRVWFAAFVVYMIALTGLARWGFADGDVGYTVGMLALLTFYLSLCCTFCPLPTSWILLVMGSPLAGFAVAGLPLALLVATAGALGTAMANLNEYHLWAYALRWRRVARVRRTRTYRWAESWFASSPFLLLTCVSFVPIPVDVVRWFASVSGYSRGRFFAAYYIGRWARYFLLAYAAAGLQLGGVAITIIQGALVVVAAIAVLYRKLRKPDPGEESP